jgi:oxalate decarboxylase/phosphoglucose isomerase-like protein (cupin superfamily)
MRYSATTLTVAIAAAFAAGLVVSSMARYAVSDARAQTVSLTLAVFEVGSMKHGDIPTTSNPEMNSRLLVDTSNATIAVQSGNVAKHIHPKTDEIQYIIEGSGSMWLGTERKEFRPGTLIVIPKGDGNNRHQRACQSALQSRFHPNRVTTSFL